MSTLWWPWGSVPVSTAGPALSGMCGAPRLNHSDTSPSTGAVAQGQATSLRGFRGHSGEGM